MFDQLTPEMQAATALFNNPEIQESIKHFNSLEIQKAIEAVQALNEKPWLDVAVYNTSVQSALATLRSFQGIILPSANSLASIQEHFDTTSQALLDSVFNALTLSELYLAPEAQGAHKEKIQATVEEAPKKQLTLSDLFALLTLLVSIYAAIIATKPNEQLEHIIQQDQIIIEQQTELAPDDKALYNALHSLTESINLLSDEVQLLREQLESLDDPPRGPVQTDDRNCQQQNSDTHN